MGVKSGKNRDLVKEQAPLLASLERVSNPKREDISYESSFQLAAVKKILQYHLLERASNAVYGAEGEYKGTVNAASHMRPTCGDHESTKRT